MRGESCACRGQRRRGLYGRCFVFSVRLGRNTRLKYPAHMSSMAYAGRSRLRIWSLSESCADRKTFLFIVHTRMCRIMRKAHGCGIEDAARTLRYAFLSETAKKIDADAIALAHHRRDQAETVLLHAARGSDLRGLCAMRMRRGRFIRPFLNETPGEYPRLSEPNRAGVAGRRNKCLRGLRTQPCSADGSSCA